VSGTGEGSGRARLAGEGLAWLLLLLCLAAFLAESWAPAAQLDDAYISYRYARNLVEGAGLVYNPGEYVEGYTNLLWTLLVAAGLALGLEAEAAGHLLGLGSGAALLVASFGYARALLGPSGRALAGLAPVLVATSAAFARWSTSGMETPLFVAAATAALWAAARGRTGGSLLAACTATLTRPDGVLVAAVALGALLVHSRREPRRALAACALFAALLLVYTGFRLAYYGALLPNTFYAKVPGTPTLGAVRYVGSFLADGPALLLPPALFAAWRDPRARAGAAWLALVAAYVVAVGGDAFALHRFLLPALPALAALALRGMQLLGRERRGLGAAAAACVAAAAFVQVYGWVPAWAPSKRAEALADARWLDGAIVKVARKALHAIRARGEPVSLVASTGIGWLGYHSRYRMIDMLGLVDVEIARGSGAARRSGDPVPGHLRSNAGYILSRAPDYILIRREARERERLTAPESGSQLVLPRLNAELDLYAHPEFARLYVWDEAVQGYRRRSGVSGASAQPTGRSAGSRSSSKSVAIFSVPVFSSATTWGLRYSQTISPEAAISKARPRSDSVTSVLPLGSRWLEPQQKLKKSGDS
jgi:hypothetical protein